VTARAGKVRVAVVGVASLTLFATGCQFSASTGYYIQPDELASQVATELAKSVGADAPPDLNCGTERIRIEEGRVVDCILSVVGDADRYAVVVTLEDVDGKDFVFDAKVGAEPLPR